MARYRFALSTADAAPATAPILLTGSICENLASASGLGYDAIEIHMRENAVIDVDSILKTCERHRMGIAAVVTGRLATQEHVTLTDASPAGLEKAVSGVRKYIDMACALKTDIIIGWIRGQIRDGLARAEYEAMLAAGLKPLTAYARGKNVRVLIEAINRYELNTLNTAEEICGFADRFAIENVFVHLDTFHMNIEEADMARTILMCRDRLGYIHFADSNRKYPGAGHIDFPGVLEALDAIGYSGCISMECLPYPDGRQAARNAVRYVKQLLNDEGKNASCLESLKEE